MWTARVLSGKAVHFLSQWLSKYREKLGKWMVLFSSNTDILRSRLVSFWSSWNIKHFTRTGKTCSRFAHSFVWSSAYLKQFGHILQDRQYIYIYTHTHTHTHTHIHIHTHTRDIEAHSPTYWCLGKAICHLWSVRLYSVFPHYLIKGTIFEKIYWTQNLF
jgi:hypothetical protein